MGKRSALSLATVAFALAILPGYANARATELQLDAVPIAGQAQVRALAALQAAVATATHGQVHVKVRIGLGQMTPAAMVEGIMFGDTDMLSGELSHYLPLMIDEVSGLSTPFLVPGAQAARGYIASPLMDEAREKVFKSRHIRFLDMSAVRQPFHVMVGKRAIPGPAELKGLKLTTLTPITKIAAGLWQGLGVIYVAPLPQAELAAALRDGRIDAVVFPDFETARASRLDRTGYTWTAVDDCAPIWEISVNETAWSKLTPADQAAVTTAARAAAAVFQQTSDAETREEQLRPGHAIATFDAMAARRLLEPAYHALADQGLINPKVLATADALAR